MYDTYFHSIGAKCYFFILSNIIMTISATEFDSRI